VSWLEIERPRNQRSRGFNEGSVPEKKKTKVFQTVERIDTRKRWPVIQTRFPPPLRREERGTNPSSPPFLPPAEKKKKEDAWTTKENHPVPIDHREDGNLSRPPREACISILTLETRAPSKERREEWFRTTAKNCNGFIFPTLNKK
jgi:hypothetical protein